mmetsp:Transcript_9408/g.33275  ORF Transcript_9408/g.33275 Transcript_9408/m.33275 type:complete len:276 (+) Transcript_9408:385-1212(+)
MDCLAPTVPPKLPLHALARSARLVVVRAEKTLDDAINEDDHGVRGLVLLMVHTQDVDGHFVLKRDGDDHLPGINLQMHLGLHLRHGDAHEPIDVVSSNRTPRNGRRVLLMEDLVLHAIPNQEHLAHGPVGHNGSSDPPVHAVALRHAHHVHELFVHYFRQGHQAKRGATGVGDHGVRGLVLLVVHTQDVDGHFVLQGDEDDHLLGINLQMQLGLHLRRGDAHGPADVVHSNNAPKDGHRVLHAEDLVLPAIHKQEPPSDCLALTVRPNLPFALAH